MILLDVTNNLDYVEDVKDFAKRKELTLLENGGSLIFDQKGWLVFLPLNIQVNDIFLSISLSLKDVNNILLLRMTMDTWI